YHFVATASDSDGDALSYSWNFGDSSAAATGADVTHDYSRSGSFAARVTVTDTHGASTVADCPVDVASPAIGLSITLPDKD
ncbi:PKD domain-containing protein, partial [Klebsiella pneumoniae]|nr:PKD domain-containing protein [Klebsiella pneumoniae]